MQEKHVYEYAVIRILPKVEREEFINAGVILFSKQANYLKALYKLDEKKLSMLTPDVDIDSLRKHLDIFNKVCTGDKEGGLIASLDLAERFRWLTAPKNTLIQTSRPHPGCSGDLDYTLNKLFTEMVL